MTDIAREDAEILKGYHDFKTLAPALHRKLLYNNIARPFNESSFVEHVASQFAKYGYRKLKYLESGKDAVIFETTENQLLRFCYADKVADAKDHPAVLQPIQELEMNYGKGSGKLYAAIMPRVRIKGVTAAHRKQLGDALYPDFYLIDNLESDNVGLIDIPGCNVFNLPVLLDSGCIQRISHKPYHKDALTEWYTKDGKPLQHLFDPRIGKGASGVITDEKRDEWRVRLPNSRIIMPTIDAGGYSKDIKAALQDEAAKIHLR